MRASTDTIGPDFKLEWVKLKDLITRNESTVLGKFLGDRNVSKECFIRFLIEQVESRASNGHAWVLQNFDEKMETIEGFAMVEEAVWDSHHFGKRIGKLTLSIYDPVVTQEKRRTTFEALAEKTKLDMISARVNLNDLRTIQALQNIGGILTDILLTFRFDLGDHVPLPTVSNMKILPANETEAEELATLGGRIFQVDRFHGDENLPRSKSDELYSKWVGNSVRGKADRVLVARDNDRIAGFITCKLERIAPSDNIGIIDLVGVNPSFAGQGVGSNLVYSALMWFHGKVQSVYVGTQAANFRAVRLYENSRFVHTCSEATLHLWFDR